ncbi:TolC family outer membrane protein [Cognatishimia sp. WU-CL00825]|uniref:TolC family outer membrane protein n=1 Tax=Cognatishimia sp. WU-CL00825 TaxID=3127658 RepID=UPI00310B25A4
MGVKQIFLAAIVTATLSPFAGQQAKAESLSDAMASAYTHSGLLEQNRALLRAADENVAQAAAAMRPVLGWLTNYQRTFSSGSVTSASNTANVGLTLSWLLGDSGASKALMAAQEQTVMATRQSLLSVEQAVLLSAVQAFMDVRQHSEIVSLRQNNLRLITRELRAAKDRFDVGEVTRTDVALAEARLAGARAELGVAQGNLMQAQESYKAVVGRAHGVLTPPSRLPYTSKTLDQAKAVAVRTHPDMLGAQYSVAAAEHLVRRAEAGMLPTINLSANVTATENLSSNSNRQTGSITFGTSGPIYQGGRLSSALRQTMAQRDAARGALHAQRHTVRLGVGSAWALALSSRAQREASTRQIRAARIAFDGVREEAKLGARTTLDVLNAEQELLDAQANQISAVSREFVAAYRLLAAMGLLNVDHLNLAVEKYDPEAYYKKVKTAPAILSKRGRQLDKVLRSIGKE